MNDPAPADAAVEGEADGGSDDPFATVIATRKLKQRTITAKIVDPKARGLVERAAKAAGLSFSQLVDLIADSGLIAVPPPNEEIIESSTLGELGAQLHREAADVLEDERPAWFSKLMPKQRIALVVAMRHDGWAAQTISQQFGVALRRVQQAYTQHAGDLGEQVVSVRLSSIAGMIELAAQRAQQGASVKEDWGTFWRIEKDKLAMFQDLGIVRRAISQVEVTHKLDDAQAEEIKRMVDLQRKIETRREEIKLIDSAVVDGDATPEMTDE